MTRKEIYELLVFVDSQIINNIANNLRKKYKIHIVKKQLAMVMIKVNDTVKKEDFYLGEVLVSEAEVIVNNYIGYVILIGNDLEKTVNSAIIDAVCCFDENEKIKILNLLKKEYKKFINERKSLNYEVLETKVNFENMVLR